MNPKRPKQENEPSPFDKLAPFWPGPVITVVAFALLLPEIGRFSAARGDYTYLAIALGLDPVPTLTNPVWYWVSRFMAGLGGATALHLLSAICVAFTAWAIYEILRCIPHDRSAEERFRAKTSMIPSLVSGLTGAMLFLFGRFFFQRHLAVGPIPLDQLLWVLLLLAFTKAVTRPTPLRLSLWWLLFGLAAAESPAVALWLPIFGITVIILFQQRVENPIHLFYTPFLALIGLALLLSLPLTQVSQGVQELTLFESSSAMVRRTLGTASRSLTGLLNLYIPVLAALVAGFLPGAFILLRKPDRTSEHPVNAGILISSLLAAGGIFLICDPANISPMAELVGKGTGWSAPYLFIAIWTGYLAGYAVILLSMAPTGPQFMNRKPVLPLPMAWVAVIVLALFFLPTVLFTLVTRTDDAVSRGFASVTEKMVESAEGAEALIVKDGFDAFPESRNPGRIPEMIPINEETLAPTLRVQAHFLGIPVLIIDSLSLTTDWGQRWARRKLQVPAGAENEITSARVFFQDLLQASSTGRDFRFLWEPVNLYYGQYRLVPKGLAYGVETAGNAQPWSRVESLNDGLWEEWFPPSSPFLSGRIPNPADRFPLLRCSRWQNDLGCYARAVFEEDSAEKAFRRALDLNPGNEVATGNLGSLLIARDLDWESTLSDILQKDPRNHTAFRALIQGLIDAEQLDRARELAAERTERQPDNVLARLEYIRVLLLQENFAEALMLLRDMQEEHGINPTFKELLYYCLQNLRGEEEPASADEEKLLESLPQALADRRVQESYRMDRLTRRDGFVWSSTLLTLSGMRETARGDLAGAVAQFEAALGSATSENQALRNFVGRLKLLDQRPEEALSDFESMLESNPQDVQAWIGAIQAAILAEKQDDAARLLEGVRAIAPDDPEVLHLTGLLQMERGEYDEAIETFEKALEKQPETPHTEFALGVCLLQTGKTQAAELALNSAFQATPTNTPLFRTLIQHYKAAGNIDRMAAIARKRLEAIPGDNEAFLTLIDRAIFREDPLRMSAIAEDMEKQGLDPSPAYLGLALFAGMQNNEQEAMRRYRQVLENQPDNLIALNNLAWMEAQAGKYDSALERIDRCIEFYPGEADVWDTRGWILKGLNRLQEARESYQQAIQIAPERPDFLLHLGELEAEDGNGEQARQYLESALNKGLVGEPAERAQMLLQKITADSQRGN